MRRMRSLARYRMFTLLAAAMLTVLALGWVVAQDFRQSAEAASPLYDRLGEGLDRIANTLCETGEVRRTPLYALPPSEANRELEYVDRSPSAEAGVRRLRETRS